ncbi:MULTISPECIES: hypothetical protein [Sphingobacterium]|uniref:Uncharacterized protein n=1 Tax=Sphingobacterium populi TaxID=1812824 RepID=A0ABW5UE14_9SPHI|nr:hypothetical protein [Sphingobacterium sp. CFCC 11742]
MNIEYNNEYIEECVNDVLIKNRVYLNKELKSSRSNFNKIIEKVIKIILQEKKDDERICEPVHHLMKQNELLIAEFIKNAKE